MADSGDNSFQTKLQDLMGQTFVGIALGLAVEVGIIQALLDAKEPMTAQEVAKVKSLKARYVTELLNSLVCAHIVEVEKINGELKYFIVEENKKAFTPQNTPMLELMASSAVRFQPLRDCVKENGPYGLPYGRSSITVAAIDRLAHSRRDGEIQLMLDNTPGAKEMLEKGISVIEVGCGAAHYISEIAKRFPKSHFIGSDYCETALQAARKAVAPLKLQNLILTQLNVFDIPSEHLNKYDLVIANDVIHDLPDPLKGLHGVRKLLKPNGYFIFYDIGTSSDIMVNKTIPPMAELYSISAFHCVPQAYDQAFPEPLGSCWGIDTAIKFSEEAGFKVVSQHPHSEIFILFICQAV